MVMNSLTVGTVGTRYTIHLRHLLFVFILSPFFADQVQGYLKLTLSVDVPFSILVKAILLALMLIYLFCHNKIKELTFILSLFTILMVSLFTDDHNITYAGDTISMIIKLIFYPICVLFFLELFKKINVDDDYIYNALRFLFVALFIAIIASVFGFGYSQYGVNQEGVSVGFSGYFWSGNDLAPLSVILYTFNLFHHIYNRSSAMKFFACFAMGCLTCVLISTKVSIFGFLVVSFVLPILMNINQNILKWHFNTVSYFMKLWILGVLAVGIFVAVFWDNINAYVNRMSNYYAKASSVTQFLYSGRTNRIDPAIEMYNQYSVLQKIFGSGYFHQHQKLAKFENLLVEIDPFDLLLSHGIVGLISVYSFWFFTVVMVTRRTFKSKDHYYGAALTLLLFLLSASFTSGHIVLSSLNGFYLALIIGYTCRRKELSL